MSINYLIIFKKANSQTTFLVFASSLVLPVQNLAGCGQWAHSGGSASIWASLGRYSLWSPRSLPTWRQGGFVIPAMALPSSSQRKFSEAVSAKGSEQLPLLGPAPQLSPRALRGRPPPPASLPCLQALWALVVPQTAPTPASPSPLRDAVVDDRNDASHTRGPRWDLWPVAFELLAWPTAIGCGQQGHSRLAGWEGRKGSGLEHLDSSRPGLQQPNPDPDPDPDSDPEVFFHPALRRSPRSGPAK